MTRQVLDGLNGANPLGFLAAVGLLRLLSGIAGATARLGFVDDGTFRAFFSGIDHLDRSSDADLVSAIAALVAEDAADCRKPSWWLEYPKKEKRGVRTVADLKAPPAAFATFLSMCVDRWLAGDDEAARYTAAFGTSVARDGKGNTKPTAFHFTAANQQFLGAVDLIRTAVTQEWALSSLRDGRCGRPGQNLRWDPSADRNWALRPSDPNEDGTSVDAPLEWLAFRALPVFPTFPVGGAVVTTAVSGRGNNMTFTWPLWSEPASLQTVRSVVRVDWDRSRRDRAIRGVSAVCSSEIRRSAQGFGNFSPATIEP